MTQDEPLFRCTICGREGSVGRCCGDETRIPLNKAASKAQQEDIERTKLMRDASYLLPPLGGEVVRDLLDSYDTLLARHNALREAVAWERECGTVSFTDLWFDEWNRTEDQSKSAMQELRFTRRAARAEVDRLIANESAADCKGEG